MKTSRTGRSRGGRATHRGASLGRRLGAALAAVALAVGVSVAGAGTASAAGGDPVLTEVDGSPFSTTASAGGAYPQSVAFSPSGDVLAVATLGGTNPNGVVQTYTVGTSGALTAAESHPMHGASGLAFARRGDTDLLAVSSGSTNSVSVFSVDSAGTLTLVDGPVTTGGIHDPQGLAFSTAGTLLAVTDYNRREVSMFTVATDGTLTPVAGSPFPAGNSPMAVAFSPTGDLLAAVNTFGNSVSVYRVGAQGVLTEVQGSPVATGQRPEAVAFDPSGDLLAIADDSGNNVAVYRVGSDGGLTEIPESRFPDAGAPHSLAFSPSGGLLATANEIGHTVTVFTVGSDGALTRTPDSPFDVGANTRPFSVAFNPAGDLLATANYYANSLSVFHVSKVSQTVSFTSSAPSGATIGDSYVPAAMASSGLPVTLAIDKSASAVCTLGGDGSVRFTGAGSCVVDANQSGDETWQAARQVQQSFKVGKRSQEIVFTSTAPKGAVVGGLYTATAMAQSSLPVTLSIDKSAAGVCALGDAGKVSFTGAGTCVVDANQAGNDEWAPAKQVQQQFTVGKAAQTISFTSAAPKDAVVGGSYTPSATATSGLPVTLSIDKSAAVCSLGDDGTVSFTGAGTCVIDANQAGNKDYLAAKQVQQSFDVTGSKPAISVSGSDSFTVSKAGTLTFTGSGTPGPTVTESGDLPKGVSFSVNDDGSATIGGTPKAGTAGSYPVTITATNPLGAVSKKLTITVGRVPATLTISGPESATAGDSVTLSAKVTGGDPPSGTVTFTAGSTELGSATVDSTGRASLSTSDLPVGTDSITASYSGDGTFQPATAEPITIAVAPAPATTSPSPTTTATSSAAPTTSSPPPTTTASSSTSTTTVPPSTTTVAPTLPNTGVPAGLLAALAVLLLGAGAGLTVAATRRYRAGHAHR